MNAQENPVHILWSLPYIRIGRSPAQVLNTSWSIDETDRIENIVSSTFTPFLLMYLPHLCLVVFFFSWPEYIAREVIKLDLPISIIQYLPKANKRCHATLSSCSCQPSVYKSSDTYAISWLWIFLFPCIMCDLGSFSLVYFLKSWKLIGHISRGG